MSFQTAPTIQAGQPGRIRMDLIEGTDGRPQKAEPLTDSQDRCIPMRTISGRQVFIGPFDDDEQIQHWLDEHFPAVSLDAPVGF